MAHIQKRKQTRDGRTVYRVRWTEPDGAERSRTFDTLREARDWLAKIDHDQRTGAYVSPADGTRTFAAWWTDWQKARSGLRPSTRARDANYGRTLILPTLGGLPLAAIDHLTAQRFVTGLQADHAPATVHKAAQLAGGALRAAVRSKLIAADPFAGVILPKIERRDMRYLTPAQVATLADTIQPAYRAFVLLAAYGGLRFGELAGLRASRIDFLRRTITVDQNCVEVRGIHTYGAPKTAAGRRRVPIPAVVAAALEAHLAETGATGDALVFTAPRGGAMRASMFRRRVWQPAVAAAGLEPLRIHDLRHTAVTLWIAAGATPLAIAHRAGHQSAVIVLDRYGHLLPALEDGVTDRLEAMALEAQPAATGDVVQLHKRGNPRRPNRKGR
jgi:integrase